jgi:hypothetical protein
VNPDDARKIAADAYARAETAESVSEAGPGKPTAGYNTVLTVHAKDGTDRDIAVCADDSAEQIGKMVIEAINGTKLFQLSTRVRGGW